MIERATVEREWTLEHIARAYYADRFEEALGIPMDEATLHAYSKRCIAVVEKNDGKICGMVAGAIVPLVMINMRKLGFMENVAHGETPEALEAMRDEMARYAKELGAEVYVISCFIQDPGPRVRRL